MAGNIDIFPRRHRTRPRVPVLVTDQRFSPTVVVTATSSANPDDKQRLYQCILFVSRKSEALLPNGFHNFFLLTERFKNAHGGICEEFVQEGVTVIKGDDSYPDLNSAVRNNNVDFVEVLLSVPLQFPIPPYSFFPNLKLVAYAQSCNEEVVRTVFGEMDLDFQFRNFESVHPSSSIISVYDEVNLRFIENLITKGGPEIKYGHPLRGTFLHFAIETHTKIVLRLLLSRGCAVDAERSDDSTALHLATYIGNENIIDALLNSGPQGMACLSVRMKKSKPDAVLFRSAQVHTDVEDATPLHIAVEKNYPTIVKLLLENGANVDMEATPGMTILKLAVERQSLSLVKLILTYRPDVYNPHNIQAFNCSLKLPDQQIIHALEHYGFSLCVTNMHDKALLHSAIRQNKVNVVDLLLKNGAQVNEHFYEHIFEGTPLHTAAKFGSADMLELLLCHGADINVKRADGNPPLYDAIKHSNMAAIKLFLKKEARLDGWAFPKFCLHEACNNDHAEILKLLLQKGVDSNSVNTQLETPLFIAAKKGSLRMVEDLIRYGAYMNAKSENRRTPLHEACAGGFAEVVKILLKNGANVNARRTDGRTPLFEAVERGFAKIVQILLKFSARLENAVFYSAYTHRYSKIFEVLLDYNFQNPYVAKYLRTHPTLIKRDPNASNDKDPFFDILKRHALQLKGAESLNDWGNEVEELDCSCHQLEISKMKNERIGESSFSFYDVLVGHENQLARYAKTPHILRNLESFESRQKFPIYFNILRCQLQKGLLRRAMIEQASKVSGILFNRFGLISEYNVEMILGYLSIQDLGSVLNVCSLGHELSQS